jgi:GTP-binding protein HflX
LPHLLVDSFRATLEEVVEADLILHVIDAADPDHEEKKEVVHGVLREIGAGTHPRLIVYNKADLLENPNGFFTADRDMLLVSAATGMNLDVLVEEIVSRVASSATLPT